MLHLNDSAIQYEFFNNSNESASNSVDPTLIFGPQRDALYIVLPITVIYALIFITGLFGNAFTCIVIVRNKSMHTATNYYLFSLAVSDLLLLVSGMPQEMYSMWSKWPYVFGPAFCLIRGLAAETSTNASVLTITLFTVERYLAICHPFQSYRMSKLSRASKHIVFLWIISMALALPQALQFGIRQHQGVTMCLQTRVIIEHSFEISTFLFFFTPMILITVLYSLIGLHLNQTNIGKTNTLQTEHQQSILRNDNNVAKRKYSQSTRRVVKMLVAVVVAFFICWAPFHAQRLVAIYGTGENHHARSPGLLFIYSVLTYGSGVFYYMSTCINPILYHIMSNKFREAFKNTVLRCCRVGKRSTIQRSYTALAFQRNPTSSGTDNSDNTFRNEAPGFRNARRHHGDNLLVSKSVNSLPENISVGIQTRDQYYAFYHGNCKNHLINDFNTGRPALIQRNRTMDGICTHCAPDYPNPISHVEIHRRISTQDSISNSSLKESHREDLEDELAAYVKEMKLRVLQREKDYG